MFTGLLVHEIDVKSRTITADAYGGQSVALTTIHTARPARMNSLSAEQQAILSRSGIIATHKFFCEGDLTVVAENEVVCLGKSYRVTNVIGANTADGMPHHSTIYTRTPA